MIHKIAYTLGVLAAVVIVGWTLTVYTQIAVASAPSGLEARVATTSFHVLAAGTAGTLFATSSNCAARIITAERTGDLRLTLSDYKNDTPTATFGHLHATGTTVVYDSGLYGCGKVKAYSITAQTITISETR